MKPKEYLYIYKKTIAKRVQKGHFYPTSNGICHYLFQLRNRY